MTAIEKQSGKALAAPAFTPAMPRERARRSLVRAFAEQNIAAAELDARVLLCAALGIDHAALVRDPEAPLGAGAGVLAGFAARRLDREPVSRIIGYREFWGARFKLGPAALDPRAETETLVEAALDHVGAQTSRAWRLLELGVGSGAVLGALLQSLPNAFGVGVDISAAACAIASSNLAAHGLGARNFIIAADWTAPITGAFDIIVSNPPYIRSMDLAGLAPEVRAFDPALALDGGADGLAAFRAIIPAAALRLAPGGLLALEFGLGQANDVAALLADAPFESADFRLDLNGRRRIVSARRN